MLDDDEITAAEEGFMKGREDEPPSKKETRKNAISHDDQVSVELAKEDSEDRLVRSDNQFIQAVIGC